MFSCGIQSYVCIRFHSDAFRVGAPGVGSLKAAVRLRERLGCFEAVDHSGFVRRLVRHKTAG